MNAEELKELVREVDNELFDVVSHLICSICHELFSKPVTTPCGHSFCNGCIKRVISTKNSIGCPLCKSSLTRYSLMTDKVKSTLSLISRELPTAFKMDVEKLNYGTKELAEDLIKRSKLFQLHSNDFNIEPKIIKRKLSKNKTCALELCGEGNDVDSFVPLLKRSENVKQYSSAKKKETDDLISVSQVQDDLNSSICGPSDIDKKLEKIEKIPAEEKVKQWFDAVGDNLLIDSPASFEVVQKKTPESKNFPCSRIRIDYAKAISPSCSKENEYTCDPYEFIPSQNNGAYRSTVLKSGKKSKKLSQLKALQMLSKENIKRRLINKKEAKEHSEKGQCIDSTMCHEIITASQKFDKLLMETKEKEKKDIPKGHTLYCFSQASSVKFLDCSIYSKIDCIQNHKKSALLTSKKKLTMSAEEKSSNENLYTSYFISQGKTRGSCKRKRSKEIIFREDKETQLQETCFIKTTKLMDLLNELVNDDMIYNNFKISSPKLETNELHELQSKRESVKNLKQIFLDNSFEFISQNTQVLGFVTQEESQDVKKFKEMVTNMEVELECEQNEFLENTYLRTQRAFSKNKKVLQTKSVLNTGDRPLENMYKNQSCKVVPFNLMGRIKKSKTYFIEFIQLGRLTPSKRRSRPCVVKLVFPIGFSSFAKHQLVPSKFEKSISVESSSGGIEASHQGIKLLGKINSELQKKTSVEIQTSHCLTSEVQIQTSQTLNKYKSTEIQTSQVPYDFAEVQTTQIKENLSPSQTPQFDVDQACQNHEVKTIKNIQISQSDKIHTQNLKSLSDNKIDTSNNAKDIEIKEKFFNDENDPTKKVKEVSNPFRKPHVEHRKTYESSSWDKSYNLQSRTPADLCSPGFRDDSETKFPKESVYSLRNLDVEFDLNKVSKMPCTRNTQEYCDTPIGLKMNKNIEWNLNNLDGIFNDSQLIKEKSFLRNVSPGPSNSHGVIKIDRVYSIDGNGSVVDLETVTGSKENSEDHLLRVLKNIDMDLKGKKELENAKSEKSEESDSDFFVEQTPPKPSFSNTRWKDCRRITPMRMQPKSNKTGTVQLKNIEKCNPESADIIGDSLPKELLGSESILLLTAPEKLSLTPKNIDRLKETSRTIEVFAEPSASSNFQKSNEINQNLIAGDSKEKESKAQKTTFVGASKQAESYEKKFNSLRKRVCIVASSIKNPELIKRFVSKFKLDYSNKLTKDMTHLIVGLHENEENELLPLCTPKLLFAMANKKWIVSEFWAETCLKMNAVLAEEPFETLDPVGGSGCKNARLSAENLLEKCDVCLLGEFQTISKEEFASLIVDCGGTLLVGPEEFSFDSSKIRMIVADRDCLSLTENEIREMYEKYSTVVLSRDVIIMSIQSYKLSNFTPYLLHAVGEEELIEKGYPSALVRSEEGYDENVTKNT